MKDNYTMTTRKKVTRNIVILVTIAIAIPVLHTSFRYILIHVFNIRDVFYSPPVIFTTFELTQEVCSDYQFQDIVGRATHGNRLPNESRNIFACNDQNRDPAFWLTFELPKDKIPSFVEKITGVEFEELADGISSKHSHINRGPRNRDGLLGAPYWGLDTVENGRHFEEDFFYCGVDTERGKIFLCRWTM